MDLIDLPVLNFEDLNEVTSLKETTSADLIQTNFDKPLEHNIESLAWPPSPIGRYHYETQVPENDLQQRSVNKLESQIQNIKKQEQIVQEIKDHLLAKGKKIIDLANQLEKNHREQMHIINKLEKILHQTTNIENTLILKSSQNTEEKSQS